MAFTFPQTTLYQGDYYRLCHSPEEYASLKADGWSETRPVGKQHRPISSEGITPKPAPNLTPVQLHDDDAKAPFMPPPVDPKLPRPAQQPDPTGAGVGTTKK